MFRLALCSVLMAGPAWAGSFKLSGRTQARYTVQEAPGELSLPRVRLKLSGKNDYLKKASIQVDLGKGAVNLKDAYADLGIGALLVRVGQFKKPFTRQQLISSSRLALVDRAATDKAFKAGRDLGLMIHNGKKNKIEYALGVFNGHGAKGVFLPATGKFSNLTGAARPVVVGRLGYNHGPADGYDEVDFKGGGLRLATAVSMQQYFTQSAAHEEERYMGVDVLAKIKGAAVLAEYFMGGATAGDSSTGLHVQAGYLIAKRYQPIVRYVQVDDSQAVTLGVSSFMKKHKLKTQLDVTQSLDRGDDAPVVRAQVQFSF